MIKACSHCQADLGPWEGTPCPILRVAQGDKLGVPDLAVLALERSPTPLTVYDIARTIRRELDVGVNQSTVQVMISQDARFCWAGKGVYGLYRHGLIPGPRKLAGIAKVFLYSHGCPLEPELLEFIMKYAGYKFQSASLAAAVAYDPDIWWTQVDGRWCYDTARTQAAARELRRLGVAARVADFEAVTVRCAAEIAKAIQERQRRLS